MTKNGGVIDSADAQRLALRQSNNEARDLDVAIGSFMPESMKRQVGQLNPPSRFAMEHSSVEELDIEVCTQPLRNYLGLAVYVDGELAVFRG